MRTKKTLATEYINQLFAPEDELLLRIRQNLNDYNVGGMNVDAYEGRFLQTIIKMNQIRTVVEIGTLFAYSTIWMARALPDGGKIISIERSAKHVEKAQAFVDQSDVKDKITLLNGDAPLVLAEIQNEAPFDMAFIDADKENYCHYLDWSEKNIRKGGVIVGDNTFLFGNVLSKVEGSNVPETTIEVMKTFNQRLSNQDKYMSVLMPTPEGMTLAQKLF